MKTFFSLTFMCFKLHFEDMFAISMLVVFLSCLSLYAWSGIIEHKNYFY